MLHQKGPTGLTVSPVEKREPKGNIQLPQHCGSLPVCPLAYYLTGITGGLSGVWHLEIRLRYIKGSGLIATSAWILVEWIYQFVRAELLALSGHGSQWTNLPDSGPQPKSHTGHGACYSLFKSLTSLPRAKYSLQPCPTRTLNQST